MNHPKNILFLMVPCSADWNDGGGEPVKIIGARRSGRGPEARLRRIWFYLSRWYHYLL